MLEQVTRADRGPHDLRARRRGGVAGAGPDPAFPAGDGSDASHAYKRARPRAVHGGGVGRMAKVTIDGIEVEVPTGTTVLQACEAAGNEIPRFCYHERLTIAGNCRMCLVEVEKRAEADRLLRMPVADGMMVYTDSADGAQGAPRRDGVPADQPSARLPDLRPGRRVRPAGPGDGLRPRPLAAIDENKRAVQDKNLGPAGQDRHDPLHPVHALRPLRRRGRRRQELGATGRGEHMEITHLCREGADLRAVRQHHRPLPGRRADLEALRLRRAALGAAQDRQRRRAGRGRQPTSASMRAAARCCASCRASTRT